MRLRNDESPRFTLFILAFAVTNKLAFVSKSLELWVDRYFLHGYLGPWTLLNIPRAAAVTPA